MNQKWFEEYFTEISEDDQYTSNEIKKISKILMDLSILNGGNIISDIDINEDLLKSHAISKMESVIQKFLIEIVNHYNNENRYEFYSIETDEKPNNLLSNCKFHHLQNKINLNEANLSELKSLPTIGHTLAKRIIKNRKQKGHFNDLTDLSKIDGIGDYELSTIKPYVIVETKIPLHFKTTKFNEFLNNPTFSTFVKLLNENGEIFSLDYTTEKLYDRIKAELNWIKLKYEENPFTSNPINATFASQVEYSNKISNHVKDLEESHVNEESVGGLLFDSNYYYFLNDLIKNAEETIDIIMFFFRYENNDQYPTHTIVSNLIEAKERGVEIRVILDRDLEGQIYASREINKEVYTKFVENDIHVKWDEEVFLTHSKIVIVDNEHLIIGSHNLTAGSLFAYDDVSVYIQSKQLSQNYTSNFNNRWGRYQDTIDS